MLQNSLSSSDYSPLSQHSISSFHFLRCMRALAFSKYLSRLGGRLLAYYSSSAYCFLAFICFILACFSCAMLLKLIGFPCSISSNSISIFTALSDAIQQKYSKNAMKLNSPSRFHFHGFQFARDFAPRKNEFSELNQVLKLQQNSFQSKIRMQAPQAPIDVKITLGSEVGCQNLLNIDIDVSDVKEEVKNYLEERKIPEDFGKDCVLIFDLFVEAGKEKEAVQYFNENHEQKGRSPLQILFSHRPSEGSDFCKYTIEQHEGFVRLSYRFIVDTENQEVQQANQVLQIFENNNLRLQSHVNFDVKGIVSHNKKNRTNVKVDYAKFHLVSNAFCSEHLLNALSAIQQFQQDLNQFLNNPFTDLIKKSKVAKLNIKLDSFRKLNKYYNQVSEESKEMETKEFKYVNKGIFRMRADAAMIYNNQYLVKVAGKYESEDVFIRILKVYSKFFQKLLNESFYNDD